MSGRQRLVIERLGHQGDGIAAGPVPGPVFVPLTLPGEVVEATVTGERASDVRILTPSPLRVRPPCPHFRTCGGCAMQHLPDPAIAEWKTAIVAQALAAQGIEAPVHPLHTSPPKSRRRAVLAGRRVRTGALVGFHARASDSITAIPGCLLLHPDIMAAMPALERLTVRGASRKDEIDLAVTVTETGLDLAVSRAKPATGTMAADLVAAAGDAFARITWNGERLMQARAPTVRFGPALVPLPPGAFLQATREGEAALQAAVRAGVGAARRVADLFAGIGTFTLPLAQAAEVAAFESDGEMVAALDAGWRGAPGLRKVTAARRDLFRNPLDADELARFEAVVLDPPRAGAEAQAGHLARAPVAALVYVSCNPVTFARDARILVQGGWQVESVGVIDQFRWSAHVELVACLSRPAPGLRHSAQM